MFVVRHPNYGRLCWFAEGALYRLSTVGEPERFSTRAQAVWALEDYCRAWRMAPFEFTIEEGT